MNPFAEIFCSLNLLFYIASNHIFYRADLMTLPRISPAEDQSIINVSSDSLDQALRDAVNCLTGIAGRHTVKTVLRLDPAFSLDDFHKFIFDGQIGRAHV